MKGKQIIGGRKLVKYIYNENDLRQLIEILKENNRLISFELDLDINISLSDHLLKELAFAIKRNDNIQEIAFLNFPSNSIEFITDALKNHLGITSLIFSGKRCDWVGDTDRFFVGLINENPRIKSLSLHFAIGRQPSNYTTRGLFYEALEQNRTLTSLDLSYNDIHVDGSVAIGKILRKNKSLISLKLIGNIIAVTELIDSLCENTTLQELYISKNNARFNPKSLYKNTTLLLLVTDFKDELYPHTDWATSFEYVNHNKISIEDVIQIISITNRNLGILKWSLLQKFMIIQSFREGDSYGLPLELCYLIFELLFKSSTSEITKYQLIYAETPITTSFLKWRLYQKYIIFQNICKDNLSQDLFESIFNLILKSSIDEDIKNDIRETKLPRIQYNKNINSILNNQKIIINNSQFDYQCDYKPSKVTIEDTADDFVILDKEINKLPKFLETEIAHITKVNNGSISKKTELLQYILNWIQTSLTITSQQELLVFDLVYSVCAINSGVQIDSKTAFKNYFPYHLTNTFLTAKELLDFKSVNDVLKMLDLIDSKINHRSENNCTQK